MSSRIPRLRNVLVNSHDKAPFHKFGLSQFATKYDRYTAEYFLIFYIIVNLFKYLFDFTIVYLNNKSLFIKYFNEFYLSIFQ